MMTFKKEMPTTAATDAGKHKENINYYFILNKIVHEDKLP